MRHLLLLSAGMLSLLLLTIPVFAQPDTNYVPGTQVCWTFNGRPHGYFKAAGNGERHILISFTGDGQTTCSGFQANAPQKWLNDAGMNWDGRTVRASGDTIVWEIFTILNTNGNSPGFYAADINYFFTHIAPIDTSDHSKFHVEGLSGGVQRFWGYIFGPQVSPYRNLFSTTISISGASLGGNYAKLRYYSPGRRHWVWHGENDAHSCCPVYRSEKIYDSLSVTGYARLTIQAGSGHTDTTWDSCLSLSGADTNTNRWLWMVRNNTGQMTNYAKTSSTGQQVFDKNMPLLYPNPARKEVTITTSGLFADAYSLQVIDASGKALKRISNIRNNNYLLDVSSLQKGIYIVLIKAGSYQVQQKLMVE
ncbi:T9SS type A sorting domain-containing protein [Pseudoflavitalea sp. X16]|uniref:T9SS type A sorting domain-containing protein n=1 Tax=Paraflavitalea devenefica TaxID=2716334 RepID=UPI001422783D|nr:T9SS type A sorting domain-containing protein [Paraflavitalea devenefica]NII25331.1 T9SS type A sorting domain-containing protein [Paraflavitalea devenefica]